MSSPVESAAPDGVAAADVGCVIPHKVEICKTDEHIRVNILVDTLGELEVRRLKYHQLAKDNLKRWKAERAMKRSNPTRDHAYTRLPRIPHASIH